MGAWDRRNPDRPGEGFRAQALKPQFPTHEPPPYIHEAHVMPRAPLSVPPGLCGRAKAPWCQARLLSLLHSWTEGRGFPEWYGCPCPQLLMQRQTELLSRRPQDAPSSSGCGCAVSGAWLGHHFPPHVLAGFSSQTPPICPHYFLHFLKSLWDSHFVSCWYNQNKNYPLIF